MRSEFKIGTALVTALLFALPLSAGAADKADKTGKTEGTMDKMENKAKDATHEATGAVSDSWLTSKTKIALFADDRVKGKDVRVETQGGQVFLRGKVDSEEAKNASAEIAKGVEGVKSVKNDLQVVAPAARKAVQTNDKQITKAVETSFGKDAQLKKIDVRTDAGVVVLSGEVPNITVSAKASEMAHRVEGVKSVKNELRVAQAKAN
jgi:hyperosmotically inducible periplasmic protein